MLGKIYITGRLGRTAILYDDVKGKGVSAMAGGILSVGCDCSCGESLFLAGTMKYDSRLHPFSCGVGVKCSAGTTCHVAEDFACVPSIGLCTEQCDPVALKLVHR